jgi:hypothetical protein
MIMKNIGLLLLFFTCSLIVNSQVILSLRSEHDEILI